MQQPLACYVENRSACDNCPYLIGEVGAVPHRSAVKDICYLGQSSGLCTGAEWIAPVFTGSTYQFGSREAYSPKIDLAWFVDLKKVIGEENLDRFRDFLRTVIGREPLSFEAIKYIPYAGFEIETSDPTSKTIYSDVHNLAASNVPFKFEVIKEIRHMNRKRAERIIRAAKVFDGIHDIFLLTTEDVKNTLSCKRILPKCSPAKIERKKRNVIQKKLCGLGEELGFKVAYECTPSETLALMEGKKIYSPRLDSAWILPLPSESSAALNSLVANSNFKNSRNLCHLLLVGFEYERTTGSKHIAGSISNLAHHSCLGILLTTPRKVAKVQRIIDKYASAHGFNNVFAASVQSIEKFIFEQ